MVSSIGGANFVGGSAQVAVEIAHLGVSIQVRTGIVGSSYADSMNDGHAVMADLHPTALAHTREG